MSGKERRKHNEKKLVALGAKVRIEKAEFEPARCFDLFGFKEQAYWYLLDQLVSKRTIV